jgi:RNA polymerase sigma-70 factor (ECF subfamily)
MARRARGLRPERGEARWLYRVGRNRAIDALRRRRFEAPPLAEPEDGRAAAAEIAETGGPTPAEELMAREQAEQVRACLQRIPRGERDLLLLRFYGGLTFREAAAVLRRPLGTALWQGQRSLKRLRAMLERGGRQG